MCEQICDSGTTLLITSSGCSSTGTEQGGTHRLEFEVGYHRHSGDVACTQKKHFVLSKPFVKSEFKFISFKQNPYKPRAHFMGQANIADQDQMPRHVAYDQGLQFAFLVYS